MRSWRVPPTQCSITINIVSSNSIASKKVTTSGCDEHFRWIATSCLASFRMFDVTILQTTASPVSVIIQRLTRLCAPDPRCGLVSSNLYNSWNPCCSALNFRFLSSAFLLLNSQAAAATPFTTWHASWWSGVWRSYGLLNNTLPFLNPR